MIKLLKKIIYKFYGLKTYVFKPKPFEGVKILLYHDVDDDNFDNQINYLNKNYNIISLEEMLKKINSGIELMNTFVITFDDGLKDNFKLLNTIKKYKIKPTIFITGYINTNNKFWFNNFNQDDLIKLLNMTNAERLNFLINNLPANQVNQRESLNLIEIDQMKKFVDFQPHTISHPNLTKCSYDEINQEIIDSVNLVYKITGNKPIAIAPPFGIYNQTVIECVKKINLKCCLTIKPGINFNCDDLYSLKRIGIPKSCDMNEFIIRIDGYWDVIRSFPLFKGYSSFYNQFYE